MDFTPTTLAECLFELEGESIFNDPEGHWMVNDWYIKYGETSIKHHDFAYPDESVKELAGYIYDDYKNNRLDSLEYSGNERYDSYIGFITNVFEKQLAVKTKVGYQLTILN